MRSKRKARRRQPDHKEKQLSHGERAGAKNEVATSIATRGIPIRNVRGRCRERQQPAWSHWDKDNGSKGDGMCSNEYEEELEEVAALETTHGQS